MQLPLLYLFERLGFPVFNDPDDQKASFLSLEGIRFGEDDADKPGILYLSGYESGTGYHLTDVHSPASVSGTLPDADAQRVLNASLDEWDAFRKASEQIGLLRAEGADLQAYIPLFSKLMGNPVYIVDASYKVIAIDTDPVYPEMSAIWRFLVTNRYLSYDIIKELKLTREMQSLTRKDHARLVTQSAVFPNSFINAPLFSDDRLIGHVFVVGYNTALTPGRIALAEQIRQFIQDLLQKDSHFTVSNIRGYENFLLHLLTGTLSDPTVIRKQCRALSWNEEGNFLAAVLQTGESDSIRNEGLCRKIDDLEEGLRSGLYGTWYMMQYYFPLMKEHGGAILNYGSVGGVSGLEGFAAYAAEKEAIRGLSRVAAREWGQFNIRVNCLCPNVATDRFLEGIEQSPKEMQEYLKASMSHNVMHRMGMAYEDATPAIVFLVSDDSKWITGQTLHVEGGNWISA